MSDDAVAEQAAALWRQCFGKGEPPRLTPCEVSGNNRVFLADADGRQAIVKWYSPAAPGQRDRLAAEWAFLSYAATAAPDMAPRPLARDEAARLALLELCPGSKQDKPDQSLVRAAADFIRALNRPDHLGKAADLPLAADAFFCLSDHLAHMEGRLQRLTAISDDEPLDAEAKRLVAEMLSYWDDLRARLVAQSAELGLGPDDVLPQDLRCISPSDFGFHNALLDNVGRLRFIDFEYAGWDDPVKMVCDFFLQPAIPVSLSYFDEFSAATLGHYRDFPILQRRAVIMRPFFALKWCCIMLNSFVPDLARRGIFAAPMQRLSDRKRQRLAAARQSFNALMV